MATFRDELMAFDFQSLQFLHCTFNPWILYKFNAENNPFQTYELDGLKSKLNQQQLKIQFILIIILNILTTHNIRITIGMGAPIPFFVNIIRFKLLYCIMLQCWPVVYKYNEPVIIITVGLLMQRKWMHKHMPTDDCKPKIK